MKHVTNSHALSDATVKRQRKNGRDYLTFPVVMAREMVLEYPENGTKEYLSAEKLEQSAGAWVDQPVTVNHPPDRGTGQTAKHPESFTSEVIGRLFSPEALNGGEKLRAEAWVDVEKANSLGGVYADTVERLENGEEIEVSTGYATIGDRLNSGTFDGESYDLEQGDLIPNHLALVVGDQKARCGPGDGCAAPRLNTMSEGDSATPPAEPFSDVDDEAAETLGRSIINSVRDTIGLGSTGSSSSDPCECGESGDACTCGTETRTNADPDEDEDDDGGDEDDGGDGESTDNSTENMSDNPDNTERIDTLATETSIEVSELEEMSDDQLAGLEVALDNGASFEATESPEEPETATDGGEAEGSSDGGEEVTVNAEKFNEVVNRVEQLEQEKQELKEKVNAPEQARREQLIESVTTNSEQWEEDELRDMKTNSLEKLAASSAPSVPQQPGGQQSRADMGAISGGVERANSELDDYPAKGYDNWKARQEES